MEAKSWQKLPVNGCSLILANPNAASSGDLHQMLVDPVLRYQRSRLVPNWNMLGTTDSHVGPINATAAPSQYCEREEVRWGGEIQPDN
jgi:hypothetical protein